MSRVELLYAWLGCDKSPVSDNVLAAALTHAEPQYAARIAKMLLDRSRDSAWAGLVGNYNRLTPEQQQQLLSKPDRLRAGMTAALRSTDEHVRINALALLGEHPCPALTYLIADALRDTTKEVRDQAALALRQTGLVVYDNTADAPAEDRAEFVRALTETLRTFQQHRQVRVLETCLWFARDLGETLWETLASRHSRCAPVVEQCLTRWDNPRIAAFLLLALGRKTWRKTAIEYLDKWQGRDKLVAILRNTDLLRDATVRRNLHHVHHPRWLIVAHPTLQQLPADLRGLLPFWVCHLGLSPIQRLRLLAQWQASPLVEVHRAAVWALAALNLKEADDVLERIAQRKCPTQQFAKWYLHGRGIMARRDRLQVKRPAHADTKQAR